LAYFAESIEQRLLDGNEAALAEVIRWISQALASARFWDLRGEWVDLQQEVLARVVESLRRGRFDPDRDLRAYVQGMTRITALETLRGRPPRGTVREEETRGIPDPGDDPRSTVIARQLARLALESASEPCRDLIRAYFLRQLSYEEIARDMQLPVGTVKSRLSRCLRRMHLALTARTARHDMEDEI
jgi:RNA polymerase sigma-70 factor (ECF subfamily)